MDKDELYVIALEISTLEVAHDNLDSVWVTIDRVVDYFGPDEDLEYEGVIPKELCEELENLSDRIQAISCKVLELTRHKERELKLGLGYTEEEVERDDKIVGGIVGATVGAMVLETLLGDDDKEDGE